MTSQHEPEIEIYNPDAFMRQLKLLNENLADRLEGAKLSLDQPSNPMHVQQAAVSARSAMEIVSNYFPVAAPVTEAQIRHEINRTVDLLEAALDPTSNLVEQNRQVSANEKLSELRQLLNQKPDTTRQKAFGVMSQVDPRFESLPLAIQEQRRDMWVNNWKRLSGLVHSRGKVSQRIFVEESLDFLQETLRYYFQPPVLASVRTIDELISKFNGTNAEELFELASAQFTNGAVLEYFLDQIDQPDWLAALIERGYFDSGNKLQKNWSPRQPHLLPPMRFLRRVAHKDQDALSNALERIDDVVSDELKGLVVDCSLECSPEYLQTFSTKLIRWDVRRSPYVSSDSLLLIVKKLYDAEYQAAALNFARYVLSFSMKDQSSFGLQTPIPEWDYRNFCRGLVAFLTANLTTIELFSDVLDKGVRVSTKPGGRDLSIFWMPSLFEPSSSDHFDSIQRELGSILVSLTQKSLAIQQSDLELHLELAGARESDFFSRLVFVARTAAAPYQLDESWSSLFDESNLKATGAFTEVWLMARRLVDFASEAMIEELLAWLAKGNRAGVLVDSTFNRILSILEPAANVPIMKVHSELQARSGLATVSHPELLIRTSGWVSDSPPITAQRIQELGPTEFMNFVEKWSPEEHFPMASLYTIAAELQTVLEVEPGFLDIEISRASNYSEFLDVYLSTRIKLVDDASDQLVSEWLSVLQVLKVNKDYPAVAATSLLKSIFASKELRLNQSTSAAFCHYLVALLNTLRPSKAKSNDAISPFFFHQQAINDPFAMVLDTSIYAMAWMSRENGFEEELRDIQLAIERALSGLGKYAVFPASIFGSHFGFINSKYRDWSLQLLRVFDFENYGLSEFAFTSAHLSVGTANAGVLIEHPWIYKHALKGTYKGANSESIRELQRIAAKQVCIFFIQGVIPEANELLELLQVQLGAPQVDFLIRDIGRALWQNDSLPAEIQRKCMELWRILEKLMQHFSPSTTAPLAGCFAEWFVVPALPPLWRLETLTRLIQNGRFVINDMYSVIETVIKLSEEHPLESLTVANHLVMHSAKKLELAWSASLLFSMIVKLKESPTHGVRESAYALEAQMARSGFLRG